jgi:hypothetical protein
MGLVEQSAAQRIKALRKSQMPTQAGSPKVRGFDLPRRRQLAGDGARAGQDWIENARPEVGAGAVAKNRPAMGCASFVDLPPPGLRAARFSRRRKCTPSGASPLIMRVTKIGWLEEQTHLASQEAQIR